MVGPLIADTGGLLRAITKRPDRRPMWPPFARTLATASRVVVPGPVLTEVDYFLRDNRPAMRQLVVAAIAERLRIYRVLTIDREDFGPLRVGARFTQQLEIVP